MKHILILAPLALALTSCAVPFARTSPYAFGNKGDLVEFNYAWSAEATAIPALVLRLRGDLETSWRAAATTAQADRAEALAMKRPFNGHQYSRRWTSAGQSRRLLSLDGRTLVFTGDPPPSHGAEGLLWDRSARAEIKVERLFSASSALQTLVRAPYCAKLDEERAKRRGGAVPSGGAFTSCPRFDKLAIVPTDSNTDRRFDLLRIVAPNGVAGPYAEGSYDVVVPVTAAMRAALKPAYRLSFKVAQPQ